MKASAGGDADTAALKLAMSLRTASRSFQSMGPSQAGRDTVDGRGRRAMASGKSAQSDRAVAEPSPSNPVSRCLT